VLDESSLLMSKQVQLTESFSDEQAYLRNTSSPELHFTMLV
jgi:hypothetical protein